MAGYAFCTLLKNICRYLMHGIQKAARPRHLTPCSPACQAATVSPAGIFHAKARAAVAGPSQSRYTRGLPWLHLCTSRQTVARTSDDMLPLAKPTPSSHLPLQGCRSVRFVRASTAVAGGRGVHVWQKRQGRYEALSAQTPQSPRIPRHARGAARSQHATKPTFSSHAHSIRNK